MAMKSGTWTKTPDDFVTIDLKDRHIVHHHTNELGPPKAREEVAREAAQRLS